MKHINKKAFSLTEVLIATFIWALILGFIFVFLWDVIDQISKSKKEIKAISNYLEVSSKINNYRDIYNSWSVIIDSDTWTGSDLFLFKNPDASSWILFWVINLDNYKIDIDTKTYKSSWLWFRELTWTEIQDIESDNTLIHSLLFQKDKVYTWLQIKDLQIQSFNSWDIYEMNLTINIDYHSSLNWLFWENVPWNNLINFNLNF